MGSLPLRQSVDPLAAGVRELYGVGPERSTQLARLGIVTVRDLLEHRPQRYEDRRQMLPIASVRLHEPATVRGKVVALGIKRFARGTKCVFELILDDGTARLHCRWWNLPYMQNYFQQDDEVLVFGKPNCLKPRTIDHPETEIIDSGVEGLIHLNRIAPVYPLTEGLPQRWLRALIWRALEAAKDQIPEPWPPELTHGLPSRRDAIQNLHFPPKQENAAQARDRLAFDELLELQLEIQRRRQSLLSRLQGRRCAGDNRLIRPFLAQLGFKLTDSQTQVLRELRADMGSGSPMRRLLQGDVGSGKTVVAACCALICIESGLNVALMAPTEILAEQHFDTFHKWFEPLGIPVRIQTGSRKSLPPPETTRAEEKAGIVIGTHALIESSVALEKLGLVVIDEQHRFGVAQREKLVRKGECPHLLVMTATPIPRTLGLTLYGDLDISLLREPPRGRRPVKTFVRPASSAPRVRAFIQSKLAEGRQAFVVYPRVEESGPGVKAVLREFELLQKEFSPYQVGCLHGQLKAEEKEIIMSAFRTQKLHVLLSTSLIEVGIDVPNATVMMIENADHFGLAQLHQLRGRIGRGSHESYCILITEAKAPEARQRLQILAESTDGFHIAEADLKLRGPGDMLGQQQSGLPPLKFADLAQDIALVERARAAAVVLLKRNQVSA